MGDSTISESALKSARQRLIGMLDSKAPYGSQSLFAQPNLGASKRFKSMLEDWYKHILVIDYFATLGLAPQSSVKEGELKKVPVNFESSSQYIEIFRPLVIEEFKAQLCKESLFLEEMYCGSGSVTVKTFGNFDNVQCKLENDDVEGTKTTCGVNDLVLLMTECPAKSQHGVHVLGKVESCKQDYHGRLGITTVKLYLPITIPRLKRAKDLLSKEKKWHVYRIINLSSMQREWQALSSVQNTPLGRVILDPNVHQTNDLKPRTHLSWLPDPLKKILQKSFNKDQLKAIGSVIGPKSLSNDHDLCLIQGPPGTGKTRTIVAIISVLLSLAGFDRVQPTSHSAAVVPLAKHLNHESRAARGRVLICAQSNAAVDELVSRISKDGLHDNDGLTYLPYVVRLGSKNTVKSTSLPYFIDNIVDLRLSEDRTSDVDVGDSSHAQWKTYERRKKMRESIIREADIVLSTLSGSGGELYALCSEHFSASSQSPLFDAVVIDEAAQALEPTTLIPLQLLKSNGSKTIMVGDPKQLPATVLSKVASQYLYECSMFERLQKAGHPVTMLRKQYRMHPQICRFPSLHFYEGKLVDGDGMSSKEKEFHNEKGLGPYSFFDIEHGQEASEQGTGSLYNDLEAEAAAALVRVFRERYQSGFDGVRIGIITPYQAQLSRLRSCFLETFGSSVVKEMDFNTIDGFQGREVDILVLSTVRAVATEGKAMSRNIGFVGDKRRINVALTRAKHSLWILGNVRTLVTDETWKTLIEDAEQRKLVFTFDLQDKIGTKKQKGKKRNFETVEDDEEVMQHKTPKTKKMKKSKADKDGQ